jgi:hypothetical protein
MWHSLLPSKSNVFAHPLGSVWMFVLRLGIGYWGIHSPNTSIQGVWMYQTFKLGIRVEYSAGPIPVLRHLSRKSSSRPRHRDAFGGFGAACVPLRSTNRTCRLPHSIESIFSPVPDLNCGGGASTSPPGPQAVHCAGSLPPDVLPPCKNLP